VHRSVLKIYYPSGRAGGVKLLLNTALNEYPDNMVVNNYLEEGLLISIGYEFEPEPSDPIILQPNTHALISLSATSQAYSKQNYEIFSLPCRDDIDLEFVNGKSIDKYISPFGQESRIRVYPGCM
jgi:hypothetical protein